MVNLHAAQKGPETFIECLTTIGGNWVDLEKYSVV